MAEQTMDTTRTGRKPRIAIGFFGITRSLKWTLPSIQENIIQPARQLGEVRLFAHLYQQTHIANPRSGEDELLDPEEYRLLKCDEVTLEAPGGCLEEARYDWILSHGDAFHDGGKSLANLIHQLHSLQVLGRMVGKWSPNVVILARPDLQYQDNCKEIIAGHLSLSTDSLTIPDWQWYGGYNDRFAVGGLRAIQAYLDRVSLIPLYVQRTGGPLPAERFLRFSLHEHGILPNRTSLRASRVRANGYTLLENFKPASVGKRAARFFELSIRRLLKKFCIVIF